MCGDLLQIGNQNGIQKNNQLQHACSTLFPRRCAVEPVLQACPEQEHLPKVQPADNKICDEGQCGREQRRHPLQVAGVLSFRRQCLHKDMSYLEVLNHEQKQRQREVQQTKIMDQARANSREIERSKWEKEKEVESQAKKIDLMVETMYVKSADIMYGRNNSNYTRKQLEVQETPLKELKNTTCDKSLKRVEATRKVMIGKSQKLVEQMPYCSQRSLEVSILSDSFSGYSNSSMLSNSVVSQERVAKTKKAKNEDLYRKLIHATSFEQVFAAKRRNAAAEGFGMCWQLGSADKKQDKTKLFHNLQKITSGKKPLSKRTGRPCYLQQLAETEKCELVVNKKYNGAFEEVVNDFEILDRN